MSAIFKVRMGTVGASKTAELLMDIYRDTSHGKHVLLMKSGTDTRFGSDIVKSRVGLERKADVVITCATDVLNANYQGVVHVHVDEAQFLSDACVEACRFIVDDKQVSFTFYALKTDFRTLMFPGSKRLLELADATEEVQSQCAFPDCLNKSVFNMRYQQGIPVFEGPQVLLGADSTYQAVCPRHYFMMKRKYQGVHVDHAVQCHDTMQDVEAMAAITPLVTPMVTPSVLGKRTHSIACMNGEHSHDNGIDQQDEMEEKNTIHATSPSSNTHSSSNSSSGVKKRRKLPDAHVVLVRDHVPDAVYVGRPGPFGNPFIISVDGTRKQVIQKFTDMLMTSKDLLLQVRKHLRHKPLACHCSPKPCHADVLATVANMSDAQFDQLLMTATST
jgi:thymidine kinase